MIERHLANIIKKGARQYPVVTITGPRQSGKTTLVKTLFSGYKYVNLEDTELREFANSDPKGFLNNYGTKLIIDEVQYVPKLLSHIQVIVDRSDKKGQFILTGSQNFLLMENISQSLAGRVAIYNLLPFSTDELKQAGKENSDYDTYLYKGFYPRIYKEKLNATDWLKNYVQTYLERDVRKLSNVGDLIKFQQFLKICAGRCGQLINYSELGNQLGITYHTAQNWLSVLEASFIVFRLSPYYNSFNKRIIKSHKLYFFDTGLASYLLGINSVEQLKTHYAKGALFENLIISEIIKKNNNSGTNPNIWFWRDSAGNEVDCIVESGNRVYAAEIKSGKTINSDFFKGLEYWKKISPESDALLIYGGNEDQQRTGSKIISWKNIAGAFV